MNDLEFGKIFYDKYLEQDEKLNPNQKMINTYTQIYKSDDKAPFILNEDNYILHFFNTYIYSVAI